MSTKPIYLPLIPSAGVRFLESDYITWFYFWNYILPLDHILVTESGGVSVVRVSPIAINLIT